MSGSPHILPPTHELFDFSPCRGLQRRKKYNTALIRTTLIVKDFNSIGINIKPGSRKITHLNPAPENKEITHNRRRG
jgi:hypothetical protein